MILVANFLKKSLLFFLFFLGACSSNNELVSISGETFGTFYDIKFEKSQYNIKKINDEINNIFISINQCCSTYKSDSLVSMKRDSKNTNLFKEEVKNNPKVKKLLDLSLRLEGLNRNMATHAAGVVIAGEKLAEQFPLYIDHSSNLILPSTQYDMYSSENAGLVKFDLLGLKTLTVIDKTLKRLKKR